MRSVNALKGKIYIAKGNALDRVQRDFLIN